MTHKTFGVIRLRGACRKPPLPLLWRARAPQLLASNIGEATHTPTVSTGFWAGVRGHNVLSSFSEYAHHRAAGSGVRSGPTALLARHPVLRHPDFPHEPELWTVGTDRRGAADSSASFLAVSVIRGASVTVLRAKLVTFHV